MPDFEKGFMRMNLAHVTPRRSIGPTLELAVIGYQSSKLRGKFCQEPSLAGVYVFMFLSWVQIYMGSKSESGLRS